MYKLYNNEIKITNFLKGGAQVQDNVANVDMGAELVSENNYIAQIWRNSGTSELNTDPINPTTNPKNLNTEVIPPQYLTKRVPINFKKLENGMVQHALNELLGLETAMDTIFMANSDNFDQTRQGQTNLEKNLLAYGVNFAHDIGLIDSDGELLDYSNYLNRLETINTTTDEQNSRLLKFFLVDTDKGDPNVGNFTTKKPIFMRFITRLQKLKEKHPSVVGECMKGFPTITLKTYKYMYNLQGGVYDNLNYILNGGAVTAVVRTPNVSDYFENQLRFHERRLKNNNKALSNNSKNSIQQIIDRLKKYETELKDTFENLKNGVNIDESVVDVKLHKDKLKNARKQIKKQITYTDVLRAIVNTLEKTESQSTIF